MRLTWRTAAAAGAVATAVYPLCSQLVQAVLYDVIGLVAAALVGVGVRRHRPARPAPWLLLGAGVLLWVAGDVAYSVYDVQAGDPPFPSWADVLYLSGYPVVALSAVVSVRRSGVRDSAAWLDATICALAAGILAWEGLLEPLLRSPDTGLAARLVAAAYPLGDLLVLLLILRLLAGRGLRSGPFGVLAVSLGAYLVADTGYAVLTVQGTYETGHPLDLLWLGAYIGIGALALHPSMVQLCEPGTARRTTRSRLRLTGLAVAALVGPALLVVQELQGDRDDIVSFAVATAVLFVLVSLRSAGLISELELLAGQLRGRERELEHRATHDALTGLANRRVLQSRLEAELEAGAGFSVALLDLDDFKHVNDTRGHEAGDELIVAVGRRLAAAVGEGDLVARLGGDEFAVVSRRPSEAVSSALLGCFARPVDVQGLPVEARVSVGVTDVEPAGAAGVDPLRQADIAMYAAKSSGGAQVVAYRPQMAEDLTARLQLRTELAAGVLHGQVEAWLQPVVDLETSRLLGFEALARWNRPGRPPVAPGSWIGVAEETGLVVDIDDQVLRSAARALVRWSRTVPGASALTLAVNASGRTLQEDDVAERVLAALADEGLDPSRLVLEVTEGVLVDDEGAGARLQRLREAGVQIALDDFGTGWSSLAYLTRFPVDVLKLDRSFVTRIVDGQEGRAVPEAVLQLAAALRLDVVAEGVETPEQAHALLALGCRTAQGYLLARPAPADELDELVRDGRVGWARTPRVPRQVVAALAD